MGECRILNVYKASAPLSDRNVPLTFCFIFSFLIPRSAVLSKRLDNTAERCMRYISLSRKTRSFVEVTKEPKEQYYFTPWLAPVDCTT